MSEAAIIAVVSVIATVLVALVGHIKDYLARQQDIDARERERKDENAEWYRRTLFEKRLQALHEAYSWLMQLNDLWNSDLKDMDVILNHSRKARTWWNVNQFYLHDGFPGSNDFVGAFNARDTHFFNECLTNCLKHLRSRAESLGFDESEFRD